MTKKNLIWFLSVLVVAGCFAQEKPKMTPEQEKAAAAYTSAGALNENHEFLKKFAGEWQVTTRAWMMPGTPPAVGQMTAVAEMIMEGRFLLMRYKGMMFGQPYESIQIIGYDNLQKKYVSFWIDNTATAFFLTAGTRSGAVIEDAGLWPDAATGGMQKVRDRLTLAGPGEFTYELFMVQADGKDFKSLEARYTRKKQ